MARFSLTFDIAETAVEQAKNYDVELLDVSPYAEDPDLALVHVAATSLHDIVAFMSEDPELEDWSDIILDAEIID